LDGCNDILVSVEKSSLDWPGAMHISFPGSLSNYHRNQQ
jgi:hypothetical protein